MDEIFKFLSAIRQLTPECIDDILRVVKFQRVRKGDIILKIGDINERLYFITKGSIALLLLRRMISQFQIGSSSKTRQSFLSVAIMTNSPSQDCIVALWKTANCITSPIVTMSHLKSKKFHGIQLLHRD
jgi:signal-transduction protein with cAMP-binding, CBS, and nucleotidyltransferase domain